MNGCQWILVKIKTGGGSITIKGIIDNGSGNCSIEVCKDEENEL